VSARRASPRFPSGRYLPYHTKSATPDAGTAIGRTSGESRRPRPAR
jgi:hypothetical protein